MSGWKRSRRPSGWSGAFTAALLCWLCGCGAPAPRSEPPALAPPPAPETEALDREQALALARAPGDPSDAIRALDARPFAFALTPEALDWFEAQGTPAGVLDYLRKRAQVDWGGLRGDVDPEGPAGGR